jgi:hypothetical protein
MKLQVDLVEHVSPSDAMGNIVAEKGVRHADFSPYEIVIEVRKSAGAKAQLCLGLYGPTKVVP